MRRGLILVVLFALPNAVVAQVERFELGLRLREFEKTWDRTPDAEGRKRAVQPLNQAVRSFFSFNFGGVGESLDKARHALLTADPALLETRWAESLAVQPQGRLIDFELAELGVVVKPFYKVDGAMPKTAKIRFSIDGKQVVEVAVESLPQNIKVPLTAIAGPKSADLSFAFDIIVEGKLLVSRSLTISRIEQLLERIALLKKFVDAGDKTATIERATLRSLVVLLSDLADKKVMETNYPAARLVKEAEALVGVIRREAAYYTANQAGQFWLTVPTDKGDTAVRIFVPDRLADKKQVPAVVALHGAGGSENLFFDGYGDGITQKLCKDRGWIMVATRVGGGLGICGAPPVVPLIDALAKRYPIDVKRMYLVGHSMGAGHVVSTAQQSPERFAGAAALGGGGSLRATDGIKRLPFFIGCGKDDFAISGARNLAGAFKRAGTDKLVYREYDDIEHMMIVRQAIPDVFQFWEGK